MMKTTDNRISKMAQERYDNYGKVSSEQWNAVYSDLKRQYEHSDKFWEMSFDNFVRRITQE